jgi:hypothetical protein
MCKGVRFYDISRNEPRFICENTVPMCLSYPYLQSHTRWLKNALISTWLITRNEDIEYSVCITYDTFEVLSSVVFVTSVNITKYNSK